MSSIVYGGLKYTQVRHALFCKKCKDTIESKHVHDCVYCSCGSVGVDGGPYSGNRILGNIILAESRSMYVATVGEKTLWLPQTVIETALLRAA
jgi:hypothetical protein